MSLRSQLIRIAYTNTAVRPHVLPLLRTAAVRKLVLEKKIEPHWKERAWWQAGEQHPLQVALHENPNTGLYDVTVWGPDDTGVERENISKELALELYGGIQSGISYHKLLRLGFEMA